MKKIHQDKTHQHWDSRPEPGWSNFEFNQPYEKGLTRLRTILKDSNFDPTTLWQWGTMQAMAIIEMLKTIEMMFGEEGQKAAFKSLHKVGYDIGTQITKGTHIPDDMSDAEWTSYFATVINRIAYASLEDPKINDDDNVSFHIDWCPHQDHYGAFDCRVQRYFVQGMIDGATDFALKQGRDICWDVAFKSTIPSGSDTCLFEIYRGDPEKSRQWETYTDQLEKQAIIIAKDVVD